MREKFMHVQDRRSEVGCAIEKLSIGLHGVPATGGGHQHGIQGFICESSAPNRWPAPGFA